MSLIPSFVPVALNVYTDENGFQTVNLFNRNESESWTSFVVLPVSQFGHMSDSDLCEMVGFFYSYQGAGAPYSNTPYVRRSKTRILLKQIGGWDI